MMPIRIIYGYKDITFYRIILTFCKFFLEKCKLFLFFFILQRFLQPQPTQKIAKSKQIDTSH